MARVDERGFVRKERRVRDRGQSRTDHWIEWAILVLGLAGVVALFVPFAYGTSPWGAVPWFVDPLVDRSEQYPADSIIASVATGAMWLAGLLASFLAPLVSLAQLSRCLGRPCSIWARRIHTAAALIAIGGCLAILIDKFKEGVIDREPYFRGGAGCGVCRARDRRWSAGPVASCVETTQGNVRGMPVDGCVHRRCGHVGRCGYVLPRADGSRGRWSRRPFGGGRVTAVRARKDRLGWTKAGS